MRKDLTRPWCCSPTIFSCRSHATSLIVGAFKGCQPASKRWLHGSLSGDLSSAGSPTAGCDWWDFITCWLNFCQADWWTDSWIRRRRLSVTLQEDNYFTGRVNAQIPAFYISIFSFIHSGKIIIKKKNKLDSTSIFISVLHKHCQNVWFC